MQFLELDKYKKWVFLYLLAMTIIAGMVFVFINYQRGLILLSIIELTVVLIAMGFFYLVVKTKSNEVFSRLVLFFLTMFLTVMMISFLLEGVSITIFAWTLGIPLVSYLLLGVKLGFIMTAIFYPLYAYVFYIRFYDHSLMVEQVAYANFIVCALMFWGISHCYELSNQFAKNKLNQMAVFDHLTGLYNRSMIAKLWAQVVEDKSMELQKVSLISIDLDHFKGINDQYGHAVGDQVLVQFSGLLLSKVPRGGSAVRFGGEEFIVVLPGYEEFAAYELAEDIRHSTKKQLRISGLPKEFFVSVSLGVTTEIVQVASLNNMLKTADLRLYQAKQQGRNVVINQS